MNRFILCILLTSLLLIPIAQNSLKIAEAKSLEFRDRCWASKSTYQIGESVTIYVEIGFGAKAPWSYSLRVYKPDGSVATSNLGALSAGTWPFSNTAGPPTGQRRVELWLGHPTATPLEPLRARCYFNVIGEVRPPPPPPRPDGPTQPPTSTPPRPPEEPVDIRIIHMKNLLDSPSVVQLANKILREPLLIHVEVHVEVSNDRYVRNFGITKFLGIEEITSYLRVSGPQKIGAGTYRFIIKDNLPARIINFVKDHLKDMILMGIVIALCYAVAPGLITVGTGGLGAIITPVVLASCASAIGLEAGGWMLDAIELLKVINPQAAISEITVEFMSGRMDRKLLRSPPLPNLLNALGNAVFKHSGKVGIANSPVDLLLTETNGGMVGAVCENGRLLREVNDIQGAYYSGSGSSPQIVYVPDSKGDYELRICGRDSGRYHLATGVFENERGSVRKFSDKIDKGSVHEYSVSNSPNHEITLEKKRQGIEPGFWWAAIAGISIAGLGLSFKSHALRKKRSRPRVVSVQDVPAISSVSNYCLNCGVEIVDNLSNCSKCGSKL